MNESLKMLKMKDESAKMLTIIITYSCNRWSRTIFAIQCIYGLETRLLLDWTLTFLCRRFANQQTKVWYVRNLHKSNKILAKPM